MMNNPEKSEGFSLKKATLPYGIAFIAAILSLIAGLFFTYVTDKGNIAKACEFVFAITVGLCFEFVLLFVITKCSKKIRGSFLIWGTAIVVAALYFVTGVDVQYDDSPIRFLSTTPSAGYFVFFAWFLNYKLKVQQEREQFTDEDLSLIVRWSYIAIGIGAGISFVVMLIVKDSAIFILFEYAIFVIYCIYRLVKYLSKKE